MSPGGSSMKCATLLYGLAAMRKLVGYCCSPEEFARLAGCLKAMVCELCGLAGWLIRNGLVYGSRAGREQHGVVGQRVFCSNRGRRMGCGGSVLVRLADVVRPVSVSAPLLWKFLVAVAKAPTVHAAWKEGFEKQLALRTAYALMKRFDRAQLWLRTKLLGRFGLRCAGAVCAGPLVRLIDDLRNAFPAACPVAQFQLAFQQGFFAAHPHRTGRMARTRRP